MRGKVTREKTDIINSAEDFVENRSFGFDVHRVIILTQAVHGSFHVCKSVELKHVGTNN